MSEEKSTSFGAPEKRQDAIEKAYHQIHQEILNILKTLPTPHLRTHAEVPSTHFKHQFICSSISIALTPNRNLIYYSKHFDCLDYVGFQVYSELSRIIYRNTMKENTSIFIEDCLREAEYNYLDFERALNNPDAVVRIEDKSPSEQEITFLSYLNQY